MAISLRELTPAGRCAVMGIVNVTEDSFSDGGRYVEHDAAIAHARTLLDQGADIIDIGGESTRPGAQRVSLSDELLRVIPVISALSHDGSICSVDTMRAEVALAAARAGVSMINDVSGGLADPDMYHVMAQTALPVCLMHWQTDIFGDAAGAAHTRGDVVSDVLDGLSQRVSRAIDAGVKEESIVLDPGLGFAKTARDNWEILRRIDEIRALGFPLLIGGSRKRFLQEITGGLEGADSATAALSALAAHRGAWAVRVHDVSSTRIAVDVAKAWEN